MVSCILRRCGRVRGGRTTLPARRSNLTSSFRASGELHQTSQTQVGRLPGTRANPQAMDDALPAARKSQDIPVEHHSAWSMTHTHQGHSDSPRSTAASGSTCSSAASGSSTKTDPWTGFSRWAKRSWVRLRVRATRDRPTSARAPGWPIRFANRRGGSTSSHDRRARQADRTRGPAGAYRAQDVQQRALRPATPSADQAPPAPAGVFPLGGALDRPHCIRHHAVAGLALLASGRARRTGRSSG